MPRPAQGTISAEADLGKVDDFWATILKKGRSTEEDEGLQSPPRIHAQPTRWNAALNRYGLEKG